MRDWIGPSECGVVRAGRSGGNLGVPDLGGFHGPLGPEARVDGPYWDNEVDMRHHVLVLWAKIRASAQEAGTTELAILPRSWPQIVLLTARPCRNVFYLCCWSKWCEHCGYSAPWAQLPSGAACCPPPLRRCRCLQRCSALSRACRSAGGAQLSRGASHGGVSPPQGGREPRTS